MGYMHFLKVFILFSLVGIYGMSTIYRLYNVKSSLYIYIYIKYMGFCLVWFSFMAYQP